ncbi:uncharacterized protein LOC130946015 [Arachis stenosperma]|uniref:uncharacterized protein LOC130946015 n=1 Tax=Arachis stenosperma TaxID=217475 RepID=UPI0025AD6A57|nr:uncharacterized protein LOC130946015 [Arachis stenosperma]
MSGGSGSEGERAEENRVFGGTRTVNGGGGGDKEGTGERVGNPVLGMVDEPGKEKNVMKAGEGSDRDRDKSSAGNIGQATSQSMGDAEKKVKGKEPLKVSFRDKVVGETSARVSHVADGLDADRMATIKDGEIPSVEFTKEAREILSAPYKDAIIIKVLGKSFSYTAITHKLKGVWRTKGGYEVLDVGFGYFLINEKAILNIARAVGKPIKVDLATKSAERGKYARACIQINLGQPVIRRILVDGFEYAIEYENLHLICGKCNCFGHVTRDCERTEGEEKPAASIGRKTNPSATTTVNPAEKMVHQNFEFESAGVKAALNMEANPVQETLHEISGDINAPIDDEWITVTKRKS